MWSVDIVTGLDIVPPCPAQGPIMQQIDETRGNPSHPARREHNWQIGTFTEVSGLLLTQPTSTYLKVTVITILWKSRIFLAGAV